MAIIDKLAARCADGCILGCTEVPLLLRDKDTKIPLFDSTTVHAEAILSYAVF
ncbi:MAG: aspartate/glutamate racemase family protein [Deltaproteobacteria bacterium]|nr:aspartate/glutamate racemase family protein [Deltaproteobacteria bacterium]